MVFRIASRTSPGVSRSACASPKLRSAVSRRETTRGYAARTANSKVAGPGSVTVSSAMDNRTSFNASATMLSVLRSVLSHSSRCTALAKAWRMHLRTRSALAVPPGLSSKVGRVKAVSFSDQIDAENIAALWVDDRWEAWMLIGGIVDRPSWMLTGINAVKLTVIHRYVVHVTGARHELHHLNDLTCLDVVFDEPWGVTLIGGSAILLMSGHLPDEAVVISDAVQPFGEARHVRRREL